MHCRYTVDAQSMVATSVIPAISACSYEPNTLNILSDVDELRWWLKVLEDQAPTVVDKAMASEGGGELSQRRAKAFGR